MNKKIIAIVFVMVFLLAGITNVSAINLETKSDQPTKTTNGSIEVIVIRYPDEEFAPEIAGSEVKIVGPNDYTEQKEIDCKKNVQSYIR